ncbi:hypothetical protein [Sphingomonas sp. ACRSK]|uniref:hypothetical protein n=1 Tax=Sphingomonas sp. ACRSK TaxID=2918213 RepID=UPI001EF55D0F|nr:hypothetical protein [Sphingomonas sp. ACRSK]MCG7346595.1 hypothetical protein [Sphingomonas sp. ACRSK]
MVERNQDREASGNDMEQVGKVERWCILQTSAGRTLALDKSLREAGITAWTPRRTIKRPAPGNARRYVAGQRRVMIEVDVPILPGFVFAGADQLGQVVVAGRLPPGTHPSFSILQLGGRVPLVGAAQVEGLRQAEATAAADLAAEREAETREQERRRRAERLGSERARRKALRQESKQLGKGAEVTIAEMPSLAGMVGRVVEGRGTSAVIDFGGTLTMTVEAWRVRPVDVEGADTHSGVAA